MGRIAVEAERWMMKDGGSDWRWLAVVGSVGATTLGSAYVMASCSDPAMRAGDDAGTADDAMMPPRDGGATGDAAVDGAASPEMALSATRVDLGAVGCGAADAESDLTITNLGPTTLSIAATTTGATFSVSPTLLNVSGLGSSRLQVFTSVPASATAGVPIVGALSLSTTSPGDLPIVVPLSVTPTGATLTFAPGNTTLAFPLTEVGAPAQLGLALVNVGNGSASFALGAPSDPRFTLACDAGTVLAAGESWPVTATFTATDTTLVYASSAITTTGVTCGTSLAQLTYSGGGTTGQITGWPATIDLGPAACGGAAPARQSFELTNTGVVDVHVTQVTLSGAPGFTTTAEVGQAIYANGGESLFLVSGPAIPAFSSTAPITATLTIATDAEMSPHEVTLTEEPSGAILAFDTSASPGFGSFGQVPQLGSASQSFAVVNTGSAAAEVSLSAGPASAFSVSTPEFALGVSGSQAETLTFAPIVGGSTTGNLVLTASGPLCAGLPGSIPLSGTSGALPEVNPTSLSFGATCGGGTPAVQTIKVTNGGDSDMTWTLGAVTGAGAAQYAVTVSPPPGTLTPGSSAFVAVTAAAIPSPAPSLEASFYAAQIVITTDVPLDPPHVVTLDETPLGDRIAFSTPSPLRFGQVPTGTALGQNLVITNDANVGSPSASLSLSVQGAGASAYSVLPAASVSVAPDGGASTGESIVFTPIDPIAYPAVLGIATFDALCAPLPPPLTLSGTGM